MTKGEQAEQMLGEGIDRQAIANKLRCTEHYVYLIEHYGGHEGLLAYVRERWRVTAPEGRNNGSQKMYDYDPAKIIAAVDGGLSYGDAAKKFGLTRNVVAGIMNRRPEARA